MQFIYYFMGSLFFGTMIIALIATAIGLYFVKKRMNHISTEVNQKLGTVTNIFHHKQAFLLRLVTRGTSSLLGNLLNKKHSSEENRL